MAKKKRNRKKLAETPVAAPSTPTYEELLAARHRRDEAYACLQRSERTLRSAATINTFAQRDVAVATARETLNQCRSDAAEANFEFEDMKRKSK